MYCSVNSMLISYSCVVVVRGEFLRAIVASKPRKAVGILLGG